MAADLDRAVAALAESQHGLVTRSQALDQGLSGRAVRYRVVTGRWREPQRSVYALAGAPETWAQRLLAATFGAGSTAVASHRAAARLHGIPGFASAHVEITAPRRTRATEDLVGARRHYTTLLPSHHRKTIDNIPTTTVARTLFDVCAVVHPGKAARAVDNCLARKWVTVPALWRVLDDLAIQGRNGTCAMREILTDRGDGYVAPASELERRFMKLLRRFGLPRPEREVDLGDTDQWIGRVEFVYRRERVLIEVDSRLHHSALLDFDNDRRRDNEFVASGYRVLRITYEMIVKNPFDVERVIRHALKVAAA
jgi:hypothetical protein